MTCEHNVDFFLTGIKSLIMEIRDIVQLYVRKYFVCFIATIKWSSKDDELDFVKVAFLMTCLQPRREVHLQK